MQTYIRGSGKSLPERIISNKDIADKLGLDSDYIFELSGIRQRRWASPDDKTSDLAIASLKLALEDALLTSKDIDYLLFGTMTPDRFIPGSASAVQKNLELREIPCLDIRAACCNALYGMQIASALIKSGIARNVALCLSEIQSSWLEQSEQGGKISMLFGDGASSLIISSHPKKASIEILDILLSTDGKYIDDLGIRCPGSEFGLNIDEDFSNEADFKPQMNGRSVILQASKKITSACQQILTRNKVGIEEVRWMVPHQANSNLLDMIKKNLKFTGKDQTVISVIEDYGNTSSASMGIALDHLRRSNEIQTGEFILMPAFGTGFTWGAALCRAL